MGGKTIATADKKVASIQLQTSAYGLAIPVVFGTARVSANLLWFGNFAGTAHTTSTSSGGKGLGKVTSKNTTYTYAAAAILGVAEGPIAGVGRVWRDKDQTTLAALNLSVSTGTATQAVWPFLAGYNISANWSQDSAYGYSATSPAFTDQAINYSSTAYLSSSAYDLGGDAHIPNHGFEVQGFNIVGGGIVDANPADIITGILTSQQYGMGFAGGQVDALSSYRTYCTAAGLFMSPAYITQNPAATAIQEMCDATNAAPLWSGGVLKVIPYGDTALTGNGTTYTPNNTPLFDLADNDFQNPTEPIKVMRITPADAFNRISIQFNNRANSYNTEIVSTEDQDAIEKYGLKPASTQTLDFIADSSTAKFVAQLALQRMLYKRNTYEFELDARYPMLEPMDIVTLTDAALGMNKLPVRIIQISEQNHGFMVTAEDLPIGVASAARYVHDDGLHWQSIINQTPQNAQAPVIFELPADPSATGLSVALAAGGATTDPLYGGCRVWLSLDGTNYKAEGIIFGSSRYGTTNAILPVAGAAGTDLTSTLGLTLRSNGQLLSGSTTDRDKGSTLINVGGEYLAYATATLASTNNYNLTSLNRGLYGTPLTAKASGSTWVRVDDAIAVLKDLDLSLIGQTIYIKLTAFNTYQTGEQSLASVTAYTYVITGNMKALETPVDFATGVGGVTKPDPNATKNVPGATADVKLTGLGGGLTAILGNSITAGVSDGYQNTALAEPLYGPCFVEASIINSASAYTILVLDDDATTYSNTTFALYIQFQASSGIWTLASNGASLAGGTLSTGLTGKVALIYDGVKAKVFIAGALIANVTAPTGLTAAIYPKFCAFTNLSTMTGCRAGYFTNSDFAYMGGATRPADNATRNIVTYSASAPSAPVDGDLWVDTSGTYAVFKLRSGAAWQTGATALTAYNSLSGKPVALSDINTTESSKLAGIASGATRNVTTYSASAPSSPVDGDLWVDTNGTYAIFKLRSGGAWQTGATALSAYNSLTGKPVALADINTTESTKLSGIATGATKNTVTYSSSAPGSPADGDIWVNTGVTPNVTNYRVSGAWQAGANLVTQGTDIGVANNATADLVIANNGSIPGNTTIVANSVAKTSGTNVYGPSAGCVLAGQAKGIRVSATGAFYGYEMAMGLHTGNSYNVFDMDYQVRVTATGTLDAYSLGTLVGTSIATGIDGNSVISLVYDNVNVYAQVYGTSVYTWSGVAANQVLNANFHMKTVGAKWDRISVLPFTDNNFASQGGITKPDDFATSGQNMVVNAGAESGVTSPWATFATTGTPNFAVSTAQFNSGKQSFLLGKAAVGDITAAASVARPVTPGKTYTIFASVLGGAATATGGYLRVFAKSVYAANITEANYENGTGSNFAIGFENFALTTAWVQKVGTWTCPTGMYWASVAVYNYGPSANGPLAMYFDDVFMAEQADFSSQIGGTTKPENNADLSASISGGKTVQVAFDYTGTIKSGALPPDIAFKMTSGSGTDVTTSTSWAAVLKTGSATFTPTVGAPNTTGFLSISAFSSDAVIEMQGTFNGKVRKDIATILKLQDAPPVSAAAGGGATSASGSLSSGGQSTTYTVAAGAILTAKAGTAGQVALSASVSFYKTTGGYSSAYGKWQWRVVSGTFADVATEILSTSDAYKYGALNGDPAGSDAGGLTVNMTQTGLTAGTSYEFQLLVRSYYAASTPTITFSGTDSAVGS
jgi:hypothetical protein